MTPREKILRDELGDLREFLKAKQAGATISVSYVYHRVNSILENADEALKRGDEILKQEK